MNDDIRRDIAAAIADDARATPGPWFAGSDYVYYLAADMRHVHVVTCHLATDKVNAQCIASARTRESRIARALQGVLDARDSAERYWGPRDAMASRACATIRASITRNLEKS